MEGKTTTVVEEYLQTVYLLKNQNETVKAVTLANILKSKASTVHATLARMQRDNLLTLGKKKEILLTKDGEEIAAALVRRHRLVEYFLYYTLRIPWHEVHRHAHKLEHALTPLVEEKLAEFLDFPHCCPHGAPLPGSNVEWPENIFPLFEATEGAQIRIIMIDESLEDSESLLKHLFDKKVIPGNEFYVKEKHEITQSIVLESEKDMVSIPFEIARKIEVVPIDK